MGLKKKEGCLLNRDSDLKIAIEIGEKKPAGCRLRLLHGRMTLFEALSVWELSPRGFPPQIFYVTLTRHPVSSQKENFKLGGKGSGRHI